MLNVPGEGKALPKEEVVLSSCKQGYRARAVLMAMGLLAAGLAPLPAFSQPVPVELELVLAVDTSASVDFNEYTLQLEGIASTFRHPEVIAAIESLGGAGIAVALVQWSERGRSDLSVPFHHVTDGRSAKAFGFLVSLVPRRSKSGFTAIGSAIHFALGLFDSSGYAGRRRIIDISGDGRSNAAPFPEPLRDAAVAQGVTINGLAILTDDKGLVDYYRASVIGGRDAFVEVADDYHAFAPAFLRKLVREILPPLSERPSPVVPASWDLP